MVLDLCVGWDGVGAWLCAVVEAEVFLILDFLNKWKYRFFELLFITNLLLESGLVWKAFSFSINTLDGRLESSTGQFRSLREHGLLCSCLMGQGMSGGIDGAANGGLLLISIEGLQLGLSLLFFLKFAGWIGIRSCLLNFCSDGRGWWRFSWDLSC